MVAVVVYAVAAVGLGARAAAIAGGDAVRICAVDARVAIVVATITAVDLEKEWEHGYTTGRRWRRSGTRRDRRAVTVAAIDQSVAVVVDSIVAYRLTKLGRHARRSATGRRDTIEIGTVNQSVAVIIITVGAVLDLAARHATAGRVSIAVLVDAVARYLCRGKHRADTSAPREKLAIGLAALIAVLTGAEPTP